MLQFNWKALYFAMSVVLAVALCPGLAFANQATIEPAQLSPDAKATEYIAVVRDLGLEAISVSNESGYASINNYSGCALANKSGDLLFDYEASIDRIAVSDGVVTKYVEPANYNTSQSKAGHFTLEGEPLYEEDYDFVYPYSEGVAASVNVARGEHESSDAGLFLLDKQGNRILSLGAPFGAIRAVSSSVGTERTAFLAGVHSYAKMMHGLMPFYIWGNVNGNEGPVAGSNLAALQGSVTNESLTDGGCEEYRGYMDKTGKVVIVANYHWASNFGENGLSVVADSAYYVTPNPFFFINTDGNTVICKDAGDGWTTGYAYASGFMDSELAAVSEFSADSSVSKRGYINAKGELVIPFSYDDAFGAAQYNLCTVGVKNRNGEMKYGLVSEANEVVVPFVWDDISVVREGVAYAIKDGELYAIDITPTDGEGEYVPVPTPQSIASAVVVGLKTKPFTGEAIVQNPIVELGGTILEADVDYTVSYESNVNAGTAAVIVKGRGNYTGEMRATFTIAQASNKATAAKASVKKTFKAKVLKKRAATVSLPKVTTGFGKAVWKVAAKDKKRVLNLKNGKVKVKKGAKKGKYAIKLKATVTSTRNYNAATSKAVTVKVKVK